jgi:hypothetical membrane protein
MNALFGVGAVSGLLYGIFVDGTYFKIYIAVLIFYTVVFNNLLVNKKHVTKRKNIMVTTWSCMYIYFILSFISPGRSYCIYGD